MSPVEQFSYYCQRERFYAKKNDKDFFESTWSLVGDKWLRVDVRGCPITLAEYLRGFGFDIHEDITYCLASNDYYSLKYRVYGGIIHVIIHAL